MRLVPPLTNGCWDCGRLWSEAGWVDAWIPDDLWTQIAPLPDGRGHLCIHCITASLTRIGARDVPVELWAPPFSRGGSVVDVGAWFCITCNEWLGDRLPLDTDDHPCRGPLGVGPTAEWKPA